MADKRPEQIGKGRYKSSSGKEGTLLDIVNDPTYGRDTRGEPKEKYSFSQPSDPEAAKEGNKILLDKKKASLDRVHSQVDEKAEAHNLSIPNIEAQYSEEKISLSPGTVLVRLLRRAVEKSSQSGLILPEKKVHMPHNSGLKGTSKTNTQEHPFPFYSFGMIVNMSEDLKDGLWKDLKVGAWVRIDNKALTLYYDEPTRQYIVPNAMSVFGDSRSTKDSGYLKVKRHEIIYVDKTFDPSQI